jgi:hypothetical protein
LHATLASEDAGSRAVKQWLGRIIGPFGRDGAEESIVRVLASVIPGSGHLLPLLPTLHALRDAGDTATQVSEATTRVLETPARRQAAQRIAAEIAAAPAPASIRPWLTSLAGTA